MEHLKSLVTFCTNKIFDFIAPPFCACCRSFLYLREPLCENCLAAIKPVSSFQLTSAGSTAITVHAVSSYREPLRSLILAKAYERRSACKQLAWLIWQNTKLRNLSFDYFVPVPLHWTRYAWRGYNQAELIAQELSKLSGKPVLLLLRRVKRTDFQSDVSAKARKTNVNKAFILTKDSYEHTGRAFMIVDDLMTTGATLQAAAWPLYELKPRQLSAIVAARVVSE